MGYVPGFNNDIFISYSHIDDESVDGHGWVTDFHRHLAIEVEEELGERVTIWRDRRITRATDFTKDLEKQVRGSAILLAILSPSYVKSEWCDWELRGFAGSRRIGDLWVDTKCRAIKIIKRPADDGRFRVLTETEGMKFFDFDPAKGRSYEIDWSSDRYKDFYKQRLTELGNDIGFILRAMRKARSVFLGMASPSLHEQRERVRKELIGRGYRVLTAPDGPPDDRRVNVRRAINESALSVLFYDRTTPVGQSADASAALEREVALDQRAKQIIVVHGPSDVASQPWDEPGATSRESADVEWLIEPQTHTLYHTVLLMLNAAPLAAGATEPNRASSDLSKGSVFVAPVAPSPSSAFVAPVAPSPSSAHTIQPSDWVECSVFAPPTASRGQHLMVQVFAHLPEDQETVRSLASEFDDQSRPRARRQLDHDVRLGSRLNFHLSIRDLLVDENFQSLHWLGRPAGVQFGVHVPTECTAKDVIGTVFVSQESIPFGHLKFVIRINEATIALHASSMEPRKDRAWTRYAYAFISYASADRSEVLKRVQMLPKFRIAFFQDILNLEPGERWQRSLFKHIDKSDVFFLFWSTAAKQSEWVLKEVQYALERKNGDELATPEIIPILIEGPPPVEPPPELADIHFNDPFVYFIGSRA